MVNVRQPRGRRALVGTAIAAILVLAACGGSSGSSKASDTTPPNGADSPTTTTAAASDGGGGNGKCFTTPGKQKARVRFVNLFTNSTYPSSDLDVWQGFSATDSCGKKLATVPYGSASDYIDVTAGDESGDWETAAYIAGSTDDDHQVMTQTETWKGGEQVTITFQGAEPDASSGLPSSAGGDQTFFEKPEVGDVSSFKTIADKALLGISADGVQYVAKDGAWVAGVAGQPACLKADGDTDTTRTNIGGTSLVQYPVAPGSIRLGLYPSQPGTCTGTPAIGPTTIDAAAGTRTLVYVYGTDAKALKLLVLPIDS
jgi:hypothetical protein